MGNTFELAFLLKAARNVARSFPAGGRVARELSDWAEGLYPDFTWDSQKDRLPHAGVAPQRWRQLQDSLSASIKALGSVRPDAFERNVLTLSAHLRLSTVETQIFALAVRSFRYGPLISLSNILTEDAGLPTEEAVRHLTGLSLSAVLRAFRPSSRLMITGLLARERRPFHGLGLQLTSRLLPSLEPPLRDLEDILAKLLAPVAPAAVEWDDFAHLGAQGDFALKLLDGAMRRLEPGINILLHGAPGTGKTEFCKVLAHRLGARLHAVGEADADGDEPSRIDRIQQLRLGQRLLASQGRSLVLFDEMEDLFPGLFSRFGMPRQHLGSKVHLNRLLEGNPVPTLWTTNDIDFCDPAFLRRMTFTLELRTPTPEIRARVWSRLARQQRIPLPPEACTKLAHEIEFPPALVSSALRAARIAKAGPAGLDLAVDALARAVRGGRSTPPRTSNAHEFDPANARADHDLPRLAERLATTRSEVAVSLCLIGAPGTGKSAFARHLASRMNLPVLERRASDLLDKYVGGSERNIAAAFAEARDTGAFLIFDEADSLIGSRADATRSWEISQVNEMLIWMESHPLPFACTTNLPDRLDPAALRRFSLRITFLPLDAGQRQAAFRRCFGQDPTPGLARLDLLTPGDFAVVQRRVAVLGLSDPREIVAELEREQAAKPNARTAIGFRVA
ncbi:MAG: AAA family ATPase [Beijerinckiaceae bacterium]|nr:AAA family ATPase [Beijerinckiaceae bacterium]